MNSIEEADRKIDELAAGGMLSPALLLTMAKAYAGVKETDLTKEEVKDIMKHLYFKVRLAGLRGRAVYRGALPSSSQRASWGHDTPPQKYEVPTCMAQA